MTDQRTMFGVRLAPGIERRHLVFLLLCVVTTTVAGSALSATAPWVLGNMLKVPTSQQGQTMAWLTILGQLVNLFLVAPFGMLADRWGRRPIVAFSIILMATSVMAMGFVQEVTDLTVVRLVHATGLAACMALFSTLMADYAANESRGKITGAHSLVAGFAMLGLYGGLMKIPSLLIGDRPAADVDMTLVGKQWFGIIGGLTLIGLPLVMGLARGHGGNAPVLAKKPFREMAREALLVARRNPMLALSYMACVVVRGDGAIGGTFILLWVTQYANAMGRPSGEAASIGGTMALYGLLALMVAGPIAGWLCDRFSHLYVLIGAMFLEPVAFIGLQFVDNPLGPAMKVLIVFSILGQAVGGISSQAIAASNAPPELRGSVMGFFSACGALGALLTISVGGFVFDHWRPSGPFAVFSSWHIIIVVWALIMLSRRRAMVASAA